jgi:GDP-mannose transporter
MMLGSAIVGASTDIRFTWHGYGWQLANCLFTSAYALYLRSVMDKASDTPGCCRCMRSLLELGLTAL